ncbi:MAG: Gfo/Idh/MocA family oxidoreductase [Actinobacteria bacterium]|nr:Gfo/Idh/MocA family oxidoreductase [Actinomycetota bacterium]
MGREWRAVVVGVGTIGRIHIHALRRNRVHVASVVGSSPARALAAAEAVGGPRGDPDLATALANADADVVHICTPNLHHYALAREALLAGKHVVCEKPLTITSAEAADLHELAASSGLVHAVCFNNRFYPLVQDIAARMRSGEIGRPFLLRASIADDSLWLDTDGGWRLDPAQGGPSIVTATIGSHLVDLASLCLASRVRAVCADFETVHPVRRRPRPGAAGQWQEYHLSGEEVATLLVRFENGAPGALALSQVSAGHPYRITLEIDGSGCGVQWDSERPNELWLGYRNRPNVLVIPDPNVMSPAARPYAEYPGCYRQGFDDTFRVLFRQVYAHIGIPAELRPAPDFPTFADGHGGMLVLDAAIRSARERRWVDVDWSGHDALVARARVAAVRTTSGAAR